MRLLFFNRWVGCHIGGTENHIKGLAEQLAERGHDVSVLTTSGRELEGIARVKIWSVERSRSEKPYVSSLKEDPSLILYGGRFVVHAFAKLLMLRLKGQRFDTVSVHCSLEGIFMICFRWLLPSRYVFVLEGYTPLEARLAKFADRQLALSDALANLCYDKHGFRPRVIPVGIDRHLFTPIGTRLLPRTAGEKIILTVSRLVWHKNVDVFVEAARLLCLEKEGITFYIIGEGPERIELERTVDRIGLHSRIKFLGQVPKGELSGYYRSADVFVSCEAAVDEYWITCQESISCGTPVVWTCHRQTRDEPSIQGWGLSIPPRRPEALAHAIVQVIENEQTSRDLVQRGLRIAAQQDMANVIEQYETEYLGFRQAGKPNTPIT